MGIQDRGYYEDRPSYGFSTGRVSSVVKTLIIINLVVFVADMLSPDISGGTGMKRWLSDFLMLKPNLFKHPWDAWQLLTAGFTHAPLSSQRGFWHIVGNMIGLYFFGNAMEQHFGSKEFLRIYLGLIVGANLVWVIAQMITGGQHSLLGASGGVAGLIVMFAVLFPHRKVQLLFPPIPIPAWVLGVFLVGQDALGALAGKGDVAYVVHLAGAGLGFLYLKSGIRLSDYFGSSFSSMFKMPKFGGPKLKVHQPGQPENRHRLDRRADEILKKVHKDGADSITEEERKILDDYSRRMRQKLR